MKANTPPNRSFVTLAQALSWIAFGDWSNSDEHWQRYSDAKRSLEKAVEQFCDAACAGTFDVWGKLVPDYQVNPNTCDTNLIPIERLIDFRQYDQMHCGLRVGAGLFGFAVESAKGFTYAHQPIVRNEFYRDIKVREGDLIKVFPHAQTKVVSIVGAEKRCQGWLREEFARDPDRRSSKKTFRERALQEIPGLSARGFDRAWSAVAPSALRSLAGRKKSAQ